MDIAAEKKETVFGLLGDLADGMAMVRVVARALDNEGAASEAATLEVAYQRLMAAHAGLDRALGPIQPD